MRGRVKRTNGGSTPAWRCAALLIAASSSVVVCRSTIADSAAQRAVYTLTPVPNGVQLKTPAEHVVFEYMTKRPDGIGLTSPSAACFHPVNTPGGERVSALAPDDHPHHRGMYLAWHDGEFREPIAPPRTPTASAFGWNITKADFWGWGQYAPRDGRIIENKSVTLAAADEAHAELDIHNDWNVASGTRVRKMLDEYTKTSVTEREGVYVIDLSFRLTAVVDYQLNRQSFSGFNFQARKDGESHYTNSAGTVTLRDAHYSTPDLNWPPAPWYGFVITLANGKTVGVAVLDHPSNPPTTWHQSRGLWMINPNIAALGPVTLHAGVPFTLRYRVVVHDGPTPASIIAKLADEWRAIG